MTPEEEVEYQEMVSRLTPEQRIELAAFLVEAGEDEARERAQMLENMKEAGEAVRPPPASA